MVFDTSHDIPMCFYLQLCTCKTFVLSTNLTVFYLLAMYIQKFVYSFTTTLLINGYRSLEVFGVGAQIWSQKLIMAFGFILFYSITVSKSLATQVSGS